MIGVADYIGWGWALVSIPSGSKGPQRKGWNLVENAITTPEDAAALTGNVGLLPASWAFPLRSISTCWEGGAGRPTTRSTTR